jgi:uncharacterized membrane protein YgcG
MVDSTQCSRERTETTTEACPYYAGATVTKQRTVRETMAPDLSSVQTSSAGAWSIVGAACPLACPAWATDSHGTACWAWVNDETTCWGTDLYRVPVLQVFDRTNGAVNRYPNYGGSQNWVAEWNSPACGYDPPIQDETGNTTGECCNSGNTSNDSSNSNGDGDSGSGSGSGSGDGD